VSTYREALGTAIVGIPPQEQGVRPTRALPYELNVYGVVDASAGTYS